MLQVHVIHFFGADVGGPTEKAKAALFLCGPEVLHGATTTLLGTGVLLAGSSYAFRVFARMTVAVIAIGVLHGLVVLPVVLRLLGHWADGGLGHL